MNMFVGSSKTRSGVKVKAKAPTIKIGTWDGTPAPFFARYGQAIKMAD